MALFDPATTRCLLKCVPVARRLHGRAPARRHPFCADICLYPTQHFGSGFVPSLHADMRLIASLGQRQKRTCRPWLCEARNTSGRDPHGDEGASNNQSHHPQAAFSLCLACLLPAPWAQNVALDRAALPIAPPGRSAAHLAASAAEASARLAQLGDDPYVPVWEDVGDASGGP